ncbi:MAG: hypothetical protein ABFD44_01375 [Anaerolineaceae bacterium]
MTDDSPAPLFCYNHPQTETNLRCNRCERPICTKCAVLTPTGYRCKECVRGQQKVFDTSRWYDYPLALVIAAGLSYIGGLLVTMLGLWGLLLAPVAGMVIAEGVRLVTRKRRSRRLFQLTAVGVVAGGLPHLLLALGSVIFSFTNAGVGAGLYSLLPVIWPLAYLLLVTPTVYYRLSGIQMR